jgi:DNA-binding response OmpR family regulator
VRVLVVEDDAAVLASVRRALSYEGYAVDGADDGLPARALAREQPPDLVTLDVMLPGRCGHRRIDLTAQEFKLLEPLLQHARQVLSRAVCRPVGSCG